MRILLQSLWLLLVVPGLACGQTAARPADSSASTSDVGTQLDAEALRAFANRAAIDRTAAKKSKS